MFVSTVVTGDAHGALLTEDSPLPVQTAYGRSKQEGEALLAGSGLDVTVVRPVPRLRRRRLVRRGDRRPPAPARALRDRRPRRQPVGHGARRRSRARPRARRASPAAAGEIYHCADDTPTTYAEAVWPRRRGARRRARRAASRRRLAKLVAGSGPIITVTRSARTSNAKLKAELGWEPAFPDSREGIPAVVAQLR